ncbi:hypothetical protein J0A68_18625 [Algoriphagus sp. H41]|uniref:Uncharacterized protein n=1 Tax=Algoriphagus oliviformis TaxID=2811231 RepID=A0ABS3C783_9BACT|nr:hypothetical protein [Algoriphagus oliviformis]MBN7812978.1 hypothetical protein [Algoriphagus oliviformis]
MKKTLLFLLYFVAVQAAFCQVRGSDSKENLQKSFLAYNKLIIDQEFEKSLDYMLPEFFEIVPRSQMVTLMNQIYQNPDLDFEMGEPTIGEVGDIRQIEGKYYSEISYSYDIKMRFNNMEKSDDEEQNRMNQNLLRLALEKTFGPGNVVYDEESTDYNIHSIKNAYGISENGNSDWKFVVVEKDQKFILEKLLPKELTQNL